MHIVSRIRKIDSNHFEVGGKIFDSYVKARLEMVEWVKRCRRAREARQLRGALARMQATNARDFMLGKGGV